MKEKYLNVNQQLELLKNDDYETLLKYQETHNLNYRVVRVLLQRLLEKQAAEKQSTSIH